MLAIVVEACKLSSTDPGSPPVSITLARVTSLDQTSYCHFRRPSTPHSTRPVCKPTRMFKLTSVASATDLQEQNTWSVCVCGGGGCKVTLLSIVSKENIFILLTVKQIIRKNV